MGAGRWVGKIGAVRCQDLPPAREYGRRRRFRQADSSGKRQFDRGAPFPQHAGFPPARPLLRAGQLHQTSYFQRPERPDPDSARSRRGCRETPAGQPSPSGAGPSGPRGVFRQRQNQEPGRTVQGSCESLEEKDKSLLESQEVEESGSWRVRKLESQKVGELADGAGFVGGDPGGMSRGRG